MALKTAAQLLREPEWEGWLRWMLADDPAPLCCVALRPADYPALDVPHWARFITDQRTADLFRSLDAFPVETERVIDPLDPSQALVRWQVVVMPDPYDFEEEAA